MHANNQISLSLEKLGEAEHPSIPDTIKSYIGQDLSEIQQLMNDRRLRAQFWPMMMMMVLIRGRQNARLRIFLTLYYIGVHVGKMRDLPFSLPLRAYNTHFDYSVQFVHVLFMSLSFIKLNLRLEEVWYHPQSVKIILRLLKSVYIIHNTIK